MESAVGLWSVRAGFGQPVLPLFFESGHSWRHFTSGFWWGSKHVCRDFGELRLSFFSSNFAPCHSRKFTAVSKVSLAVLFFNQFDFFTVQPHFADRLDFYRRESFCCVVTATELVQCLYYFYLKLVTFLSFSIPYRNGKVPAMFYLFYLVPL